MKKNVVVAFVGTLVIAAFVFSGMSFKPGSLQELKAKGACECKWDPQYPAWCTDNYYYHAQWYVLECN